MSKMQVKVAKFKPASFSSQNLFQLCYPHILIGGDASFTLLYNYKEQDEIRFWMSPPPKALLETNQFIFVKCNYQFCN